jgi:hypothetical protein
MSTASRVKKDATRAHTIPPSVRRPAAIMDVSASHGTTSLAVMPPRAYPTGEELGSNRPDYGGVMGNSEIDPDSRTLFEISDTTHLDGKGVEGA